MVLLFNSQVQKFTFMAGRSPFCPRIQFLSSNYNWQHWNCQMCCVLLSAYVTKRHSNGVFLTILRGLKKNLSSCLIDFPSGQEAFIHTCPMSKGSCKQNLKATCTCHKGKLEFKFYCEPCLLFDLQVGTMRPFQSNIPQAVHNTACKMNVWHWDLLRVSKARNCYTQKLIND